MLKTKQVKLTRSICLAGRHAEKGSIHDLAQSLADDLIGQESAVLQNIFCFLARLRFFVNNRRRADEEESRRSRMSTTAKADRFLILNGDAGDRRVLARQRGAGAAKNRNLQTAAWSLNGPELI